MNYVIWKGFLVLALNQPITLKPNGGVLWVSKKDSVKIQTQSGQATLMGIKQDLVYLSGFKTGLSEPTATLITTNDNLLALKRCPSIKNISVINQKLTFSGNSIMDAPYRCGFDDLQFLELDQNFSEQNIRIFLQNETLLKNSGLKISEAAWESRKRKLRVYSSQNKERILEKIPVELRPFYEIEIKNKLQPGKNIIFELTLFEFSKNKARKLGLRWPSSISLFSIGENGNFSQKISDLSSGTNQELMLGADFGESQGVGKVIAQPTLRTQPGIKSTFRSGGEFPVKNSNALQSQTTWKSYGLNISITPNQETEIGDTEIALDFNLEFSEPNLEHVIDGVPSIFQRNLESRFDIRTDELTVLTSMLTLREGKGRAGLAFFQQIPILSPLFSIHSQIDTNSELWFALRPTWEEIPIRENMRKFARKSK